MDESNIGVALAAVEVVNATAGTMVQLATQRMFENNQRCMAPIVSSTRHSKVEKIEVD